MLNALFVILYRPSAESRLVDDLANVLIDEIVCLQISLSPKAKPLLFGLYDGNGGILL